MLGNQPIDVMLLSTDLAVAKDFYGDRIGLEILIETDDFLTFKCGGDSRLVLTKGWRSRNTMGPDCRPSTESPTWVSP
jgi:catechol-2,3-dioxygenase